MQIINQTHLMFIINFTMLSQLKFLFIDFILYFIVSQFKNFNLDFNFIVIHFVIIKQINFTHFGYYNYLIISCH